MLNNLITIENIQNWYESGNWTDLMVQKAIELGYITDKNFETIKANIEAKKQEIEKAQKAEQDRIEAEELAKQVKEKAEAERQAELENSMTDEGDVTDTDTTDTDTEVDQ